MKVWLKLAEHYFQSLKIDCSSIVSNPCDRNDPMKHRESEQRMIEWQIIKDLHRTGSKMFNEDQRENLASLKKVLLGFARYNPS